VTASWEHFGHAGRPRRIRGGEIPAPQPLSWREAQRQARGAEAAARQAEAQAAYPPEPEPVGVRIGPLWLDADASFAFLLFLPMVFLVQFGTLGAAMIAGLTPLYLFVRRRGLGQALGPRLVLFAFPLFAVLSAMWSEAPLQTLRYALELCITATAATLIASARDQRAVLRGIALAFAIYVVVALAVGGRVVVGVGAGGDAFSGLTESKNLMAEIGSTGFLLSLAASVLSARQQKWLWAGFFLVAALGELYSVVAARSAGALLGLACGIAPLLVLTPLVAAGRAVRGWAASSLALAMLVVALNARDIAQALIGLGAAVFDKDTTLTGRTYLWYRAADLIHEKPLLGRGYFSFWLQGNIDAEGLWRYAGITDRSGFNFHNTLVDLLVTVGWLGAAVLLGAVFVGVIALIRRFIHRPSLTLVFWISLLTYELSRTPIETLGIQPFYFSTTLAMAALGFALGRPRERRSVAHQPIRPTVEMQAWPVEYAQDSWANPRLTPARGSLRVLRGGLGE
jgi:exopolysaccharide production protein ExoQ